MSRLRTLVRVLAGLLRHPVGRRHPVRTLFRFVRWQVVTRLRPGPREVPFVGATRLRVSRGMAGATGNLYVGLLEFEPMAFVLHALRPRDLFLDVGANVGVYTVLAAGVVGSRTIAVEPVPATFGALEANVRLNDLSDRIRMVPAALGDRSGTVRITTGHDSTNHVLRTDEDSEAEREVELLRLDGIVDEVDVASTDGVMLKIDVEGFEVAVLRGARELLSSRRILAVLVEVNGSGERFGHSDDEILAELRSHGLVEARYDPWTRRLRSDARWDGEMRLFIGNQTMMTERVSSAERRRVLPGVTV